MPKPTDKNPIKIQFNVRFMKRLLIASIVLVLATGTFCNFMIFQVVGDVESNISKALFRFDLGHEPSLPNFFSSILLLIASALSFLSSAIATDSKSRFAWRFMGTVFVLLSIDESIMVHETLNRALTVLGLDGIPVIFPWTIAGFIFAASIGFVALPLFKDLSKRHGGLLITSGVLFLLGALGVENLSAYVFHLSGGEEEGAKTIAHWLLQTVEESLEMCGVCLYSFVVFDHIYSSRPGLTIEFKH